MSRHTDTCALQGQAPPPGLSSPPPLAHPIHDTPLSLFTSISPIYTHFLKLYIGEMRT